MDLRDLQLIKSRCKITLNNFKSDYNRQKQLAYIETDKFTL